MTARKLCVTVASIGLLASWTSAAENEGTDTSTPAYLDGDAIAIGRYRRFASEVLAEDRLLQVRLPRDYDSAPGKRYPVLLQLDGEYAFLHAIAAVEQAAVLDQAPGVPDMIVVGIPNAGERRGRDMLPPQSQYAPKDADPRRFLRFIKDEVIPLVDADYRTAPARILVGQSTSGFFAWWALLQDPTLFQGVVSISPSFADCRPYMADEVKARARTTGLNGSYLYLGRGGQGRERGVAESMATLLPLLEPAKGLTIRTKVYEELGHVPNPALYDALKTMGTDLALGPNTFAADEGGGSGEEVFALGRRHTIASKVFGSDRDVIVRVPREYEQSDTRYPALYLLGSDDRARLALAAGTLDYMSSQGQIPSLILVGIELPEGNFGLVPRGEEDGGTKSVERYLRFVADEVFPFVERTYRSNGYRVLYGGSNSAMGALFALFSGRPAHQATIASSPMLGWSPELITDLTLAALRGPAREQHFLYLIAADDDFGRVTRHFAEYAAMLRKQAPSWLRWSVETRANEGHVPEVDLPLALRALFKGYNPEQPLRDADAFRSHYLELGRRWGFPVDPPGALLFDAGYDLVTAGDVEKGRRIFEYFAEAHPSAASAHAGLGFAYSKLGDRPAAERALKKALELDPENHLARRLLGELER